MKARRQPGPRGSLPSPLWVILFLLGLQCFNPGLAADDPETPKVKELIEAEAAEEAQAKEQAAVPRAIPADEFDRGTPRSSVLALSQALKDREFERAMNYLDMRNVPGGVRRQGKDLARQLKVISDRTLWVDVETISSDPKGHGDDGLPVHRDILTRVKTRDGPIDILMQRVPDGQGGRVWKLSNRTVAEIPRLYGEYGYGRYGDRLSRMLPDFEILGLELWQWVMLLMILIPAFLISWALTYAGKFLVKLVKKPPYHRVERFLAGPARFTLLVLIARANFDLISPTREARAFFESQTFLIIAIVWLITGLIELGFGRLRDRMRAAGNDHATVLLKPASTLLKVVVWLVALISWLDNLGFNVTTMLAGLGVGGIAVGLAAQKSIENLIGGITLYAAEPIRIGDFCKAGGTLGVVDEIGLRFTTIRTLDRTLVTIPNANLANMDIENYTRRDKILFRRTLRLRNDTTPDQIRSVLDDVHLLLQEHESVDPVPARIRFKEYGEHSLDLEIFAYISTKDFNEYLAIVEELNLRILDIIEAAGTQLAVPARSVTLEGGTSSASA